VFSSGLRLFRIPAGGGEPELLFDAGDEARPFASWPSYLPAPGASKLVYQSGDSAFDVVLETIDLDTGERRELLPGSKPVYSTDGYLIHGPALSNQAGLRASPFSLDDQQLTGPSFPIHETGLAASVTRDGTLIYTDNPYGSDRQIVVRDRSGSILQTIGDPIGSAETPAVSPDGRSLAIVVEGDVWVYVWVYDLDREVRTRLTSTPNPEIAPTWFNAGREVAFLQADNTLSTFNSRVATRIADGSLQPTVLFESPRGLSAMGWSPDERYLAFNGGVGISGDEQGGIWYRERRADGSFLEAVPYLLTPVNENTPIFSPDGRFIAYASNESGRFEIYVRPFPMASGKWQVSDAGGRQPRWSADGSELFYVEESTDTLVVASVSTQPGSSMGAAERLFAAEDLRPLSTQSRWTYDVFPDGQRFVLLGPAGNEDPDVHDTTIRVVQNWYEQFRDREQ
jgi:WD40 repeat protein